MVQISKIMKGPSVELVSDDKKKVMNHFFPCGSHEEIYLKQRLDINY